MDARRREQAAARAEENRVLGAWLADKAAADQRAKEELLRELRAWKQRQ